MQKKGFTIIEIIVSVVLIALMSVGVVGIFVASKRLVLHSRSRASGVELGKVFLEPLQMQVRQDQWGTNCLGAYNCPPANVTLDTINYTGSYTVTDGVVAGSDLRRVIVTINWTDPTP